MSVQVPSVSQGRGHIPVKGVGNSVVLRNFIQQLRDAETETALSSVLDRPENFENINASQWSTTEVINLENREEVITELVFD